MTSSLLHDMDRKRGQLLRDGYVILRQFVPAERLDRLRNDVEAAVEAGLRPASEESRKCGRDS